MRIIKDVLYGKTFYKVAAGEIIWIAFYDLCARID